MTALLYPLGAKNIPRVVYFTSSKGLLPFQTSRPVEYQGHGRARGLLHLHGNQETAVSADIEPIGADPDIKERFRDAGFERGTGFHSHRLRSVRLRFARHSFQKSTREAILSLT